MPGDEEFIVIQKYLSNGKPMGSLFPPDHHPMKTLEYLKSGVDPFKRSTMDYSSSVIGSARDSCLDAPLTSKQLRAASRMGELKETDRDNYDFDFEKPVADGKVASHTKRRNGQHSKKSIVMDGIGCTVLKPNLSKSSKEMLSDSITKNEQTPSYLLESEQRNRSRLLQKKTMFLLDGGLDKTNDEADQGMNLKKEVDLKVEVSVQRDFDGKSFKQAVF